MDYLEYSRQMDEKTLKEIKRKESNSINNVKNKEWFKNEC